MRKKETGEKIYEKEISPNTGTTLAIYSILKCFYLVVLAYIGLQDP